MNVLLLGTSTSFKPTLSQVYSRCLVSKRSCLHPSKYSPVQSSYRPTPNIWRLETHHADFETLGRHSKRLEYLRKPIGLRITHCWCPKKGFKECEEMEKHTNEARDAATIKVDHSLESRLSTYNRRLIYGREGLDYDSYLPCVVWHSMLQGKLGLLAR